jgi:predicted TIM-barrel fold metal-dependent hydrolase
LHAGYGDPDLELHRCDPLLLTGFISSSSLRDRYPLLHCYPFIRNAGYLAQVFPHVFFDVGLAINYTGNRSQSVIAESLELAPFAKSCSRPTHGWPAELHYLGARLWRRGMERLLGQWVSDGDWSLEDAVRVASMIGRDNAARIYGLKP